MPARRLVPPEFFGMMRKPILESSPACTAPLPARSKLPWNRTSCRNARRLKNESISGPYTIVITNTGAETVQLRTRHWINYRRLGPQAGNARRRRGRRTARARAGERFEYTSGVPLPTASGFMTGRYQMVSESGERFEIDVPTFSLDSPDNKRVIN